LSYLKNVLITIIILFIIGITSVNADNDAGMRLVSAARTQIGKTVVYDPGYKALTYPNGDLPLDRGVCTDVIVRAFRTGLGMDLQVLVHEDMQRAFKKYPQHWGSTAPDKNIDHRRVENLETYFKRRGWSKTVSNKTEDYRPGDLVTCVVSPHLPHIMIVSDKKNTFGRPLIIHNIGAGAQEEDRLFEFKHTGHFRIE
jgi:uncharacterized protein YijF (DUF1287 family)